MKNTHLPKILALTLSIGVTLVSASAVASNSVSKNTCTFSAHNSGNDLENAFRSFVDQIAESSAPCKSVTIEGSFDGQSVYGQNTKGSLNLAEANALLKDAHVSETRLNLSFRDANEMTAFTADHLPRKRLPPNKR